MHALALVLVGIAVALTLVCALGVLVMDGPYQRLHYIAPVTTVSAVLVTVAVFLVESSAQAGLKCVVATLVLLFINAVVTHATARAARIRSDGGWGPHPGERVPIVGREGAFWTPEDQP